MEKIKTQILCTIGPASDNLDTLRKMADAGMNAARLNFSHGTHEEHQERIDTIRQLNCEGYDIKILQDLEGFRIRLGIMPDNKPVEIRDGEVIYLTNNDDFKRDTATVVPFDYDGEMSAFTPGLDIYIDDGNILIRSIAVGPDYIEAEVIIPGKLKNHKGVNIPDLDLGFDILTEKDKGDICFGAKNKVDFIAQSFVRNKDDMVHLKDFMAEQNFACKTIAKIENSEGIENREEILEVADGIMVARGDMGVSIPIYQVPVMQKKIIDLTNKLKKIDITATQMLETMTTNFRPTRAEVSDVANAVLDGSDFVMLSGETAVGKYPVETVQMMQDIIDYTYEKNSPLE
ncbi:MAG: pyruvate kinase [Planctomycetota bacterium]|jgi:pyruvate kinase